MIKNESDLKKSDPDEPIPKAVHVENAANILVIKFDNGETRYLRSHYIEDYLDAYSVKKGHGKRRLFLTSPAAMWLGSDFEILQDGTVVLFGKDSYSPEELWYNSQPNVTRL